MPHLDAPICEDPGLGEVESFPICDDDPEIPEIIIDDKVSDDSTAIADDRYIAPGTMLWPGYRTENGGDAPLGVAALGVPALLHILRWSTNREDLIKTLNAITQLPDGVLLKNKKIMEGLTYANRRLSAIDGFTQDLLLIQAQHETVAKVARLYWADGTALGARLIAEQRESMEDPQSVRLMFEAQVGNLFENAVRLLLDFKETLGTGRGNHAKTELVRAVALDCSEYAEQVATFYRVRNDRGRLLEFLRWANPMRLAPAVSAVWHSKALASTLTAPNADGRLPQWDAVLELLQEPKFFSQSFPSPGSGHLWIDEAATRVAELFIRAWGRQSTDGTSSVDMQPVVEMLFGEEVWAELMQRNGGKTSPEEVLFAVHMQILHGLRDRKVVANYGDLVRLVEIESGFQRLGAEFSPEDRALVWLAALNVGERNAAFDFERFVLAVSDQVRLKRARGMDHNTYKRWEQRRQDFAFTYIYSR